MKEKVLVALSGGVDSSTAAALLIKDGFDCEGVFIITSEQNRHAQADARDVAANLGIKLHILDLRDDFKYILDYFCSEYKHGRTPNPCVLCNRLIKFGKVWNFAREQKARFLATGHYVRILNLNGQAGLYEAADKFKDQSYALSMIDKNILPYVMFPMGNYSKSRVREMAKEFGLSTADKSESQEICFVPEDDYIALLEKRCPDLPGNGDIIDSRGQVIGKHNGVHRFTIGQRRGLKVAMGKPYYVTGIDAKNNTVTLGPKQELAHSRLYATGVNWLIKKPTETFHARVKIRYNDKGASATVEPQQDSVRIRFDQPNRAITPGQLAAFYVTEDGNDSRLAGGGWIQDVLD